MNLSNLMLYFPGNDITRAAPEVHMPARHTPVARARPRQSRLARYTLTASQGLAFGAAVLANAIGFLMLMCGLLLLLQIAQAALA